MITKKILDAQIFAFQLHANQFYGDPELKIPYTVHLAMAESKAQKYLYLLPEKDQETAIISIWLHDSREDQGLSYNDIKKLFGLESADVVYYLTNNDGKNRKEKAINTYGPKTSKNRITVFDKLADRLGNVEFGIHYNSRMLKTQKEEFPYMVEILFVPGEFDIMWTDLADMLGIPDPVKNPELYTIKGHLYNNKEMEIQL